MYTKKDLKELIETIKKAKGWTQKKVSVEAGYEENSLTQALSKKNGYDPVVRKLKLVFKDVLENPTTKPMIIDKSVHLPTEVGSINERLLRIESHLEVYESAIAGLQAKENEDFMQKVSELRQEVSKAVNRRFAELK